MINVGFVLNLEDKNWLGGINYYQNLLNAVYSNPDRKIRLTLFTGYNVNKEFLNKIPEITVYRTHFLDMSHPAWLFRQALIKITGKDIIMTHLLSKYNISILSHSSPLVREIPHPKIGWIPDFQHKYLPDLFSPEDLEFRNNSFEGICRECTTVIFSSDVAKSDAEKFYPEFKNKYKTLHFIAGNINLEKIPDIHSLKKQYDIPDRYFLVPNQFWAHKNHGVIIDALGILKKHGKSVTVVATGNSSDYRDPDYFNSLMKRVYDLDVRDEFKFIGMVPYNDLTGLMCHAIAVINPSLFEGWSTTVEESKSLHLPIILADIPVHKEQNPGNAIFFKPNDPKELAKILINKEEQESGNIFSPDDIMKEISKNKLIFAKEYEKIVIDSLNQ